MRQRERPAQATGVKAVVAVLGYIVGGLAALVIAFDVLHRVAHGDPWPFTAAVAFAVVPWWLAAGLGIRLGMPPEDFFRRLARFAGFISLR